MAPPTPLTRSDISDWLREDDPNRLEQLWLWADEVRRAHVGDEVHLRGLIEISNYCGRWCHYCGLRASNSSLTRYRMTEEEILDCATQAKQYGYGTVVIQAGEDAQLTPDWIAHLVRRIKRTTGQAVTLSLGERVEGYELWREAGADRYLLRFETSNPTLYRLIHPEKSPGAPTRIQLLGRLRKLGYEVGSGVMIGIPGQTYNDLAADIELFRELDLDMIGCGPFIAHPSTPLGQDVQLASPEEQVPPTEMMTYKVIALARLICPEANIPATTALATINKESGRELGLQRGANIVMPNMTPPQYRTFYEIYPDKACVNETAEMCRFCLDGRILSIGRVPGKGPGGRKRA